MDDNQDVEAVIQRINTFALDALRKQLPWLKTETLAKIVSDTSRTLSSGLEVSKPELAASRNRISFMSLSAELRNRIYDLIINDGKKQKSTDGLKHSSSDPCRRSPLPHPALAPPAITRVSRQLRAETLPMYYGAHEFDIHIRHWDFSVWNEPDPIDEFRQWLEAIGPAAAGMVKSLSIRVFVTFAASEEFRAVGGREEWFRKLGVLEAGIKNEVCQFELDDETTWV